MPFIFYIFILVVLVRLSFAIRTVLLRKKGSPAQYLLQAPALVAAR